MSARIVSGLLTMALVLCGLGACRSNVEMCARCHMVLRSGDFHETEITYANGDVSKFDSAVCALHLWQHPSAGTKPTTLRVHEYYSGMVRDSANVVFVQKSDVSGPMGDDFIAVDPSSAKKFTTDHGGVAFKLGEIPPTSLEGSSP